MKRLGKYSGKIYDESEVPGMTECGLMITDEQANDEEFLAEKMLKNFVVCSQCQGCVMAHSMVEVGDKTYIFDMTELNK